MATINLGNIKFQWQGAYNAGTAYAIDDVVSYNGSSYVCILASTGNLPTNTTYWNIMSSAGTNGTDGTDLTSTLTTQGDILIRNSSGLARLGYGTSGHFLKTQGSGADPVWAEINTSGHILNVTELLNSTRTSRSSVSNYDIVSGTFNQTKANSKIVWWANCWWRGNYSGDIRYQFMYNGSEKNVGQSGYHYSNHGHRYGGHGGGYFQGDSSTGSKTIVWRENGADGGNHRSGNVHNPNSSDDSRLSQHASNVTIWEVDI